MYETCQKHCRKCKRKTHHWRDLPDMPTYWSEEPGMIFFALWGRLTRRWNCRACKGVPRGPLENDLRRRR
jgi:hypothetical protein